MVDEFGAWFCVFRMIGSAEIGTRVEISGLGRKNQDLRRGSDAGGHCTAVFNSLIVTVSLNDIDPQAWLADILAHIADHPVRRIDLLLPWNWKSLSREHTAAAA